MSTTKKMTIAGIIYLTVMFVTMGLLWPWFNNEAITSRSIIGSLVSGLGGGLIFILLIRYQFKKQKATRNLDGD